MGGKPRPKRQCQHLDPDGVRCGHIAKASADVHLAQDIHGISWLRAYFCDEHLREVKP